MTREEGRLRLQIKIFTRKTSDKCLENLRGRVGHTFKKDTKTPKARLNMMFYAALRRFFLFCNACTLSAGKTPPNKKPVGAREAERGGAGGVSPPAKRLVEHDEVFAGGNGAEL